MDKLKRHRYFILFCCTCLMGVFTAVLPHVMYLWAFFVASTICNFATGVLHPSLNVLCLDIWAEDSGPFLNSLHFGFAVNMNSKWNTCRILMSSAYLTEFKTLKNIKDEIKWQIAFAFIFVNLSGWNFVGRAYDSWILNEFQNSFHLRILQEFW